MMILLNNSGQLGNRLRSLSSFVALGIEQDEKMVCPVVGTMILDNFNLVSNRHDLKFYNSKKWEIVIRTLHVVKRLLKGDRQSPIKERKIKIFTDWISFANPFLLYKHYDELKSIFSFKQNVINDCQNIMYSLQSKTKITIAVHFRRGDYQFWQDGRYYFSEEQFIKQMIAINDKEYHFMIFSNEILDKEKFISTGLSISFMNGDAIHDLCCMSMCDYIMGPPSTYSAWAGYIGNKKLLWMKEKKHIYSLADFKNVPESFKGSLEFWNYI